MEDLPTPLSRVELYLAKACGMDVTVPTPESRYELFLAKIAGEDVEIPTPYSLTEQWLAYVAGVEPVKPLAIEGACLIGNEKVDVRYFAVAASMPGASLPEKPQNRKEQYWAHIAGNPPTPGILKYVTGIDIQLTDVISGIKELQYVYSDTFQQTYTGKNLLYTPDGAFLSNQVTWTASNSTVVASGTAGSTSYSALTAFLSKTIPAGTYTFSIKEPVTKRIQFTCRKDSSSPQVTNAISIGSTSVTFTLDEDMGQYHVVCLDAANADFTGFTISEMQLEAGSSTATPFEPYVGGVASPNPDYPQDIHVATGTQTVTVSGKNLWKPAPNGSATNGGITSVCSNGTITCSGTSTSTAAQTSGFYNLDTPLPAGTYTFSIKNALPYRIEFVMQDSSGTNHFSRIAANSKGGTVTTTWETVKIRNGISGYTSGTEINIIIEDLQLEAGSEVTTYQAYQSQSYLINLGSTELCKIGEYQDYIYKSGNDWYVHKAVGKKEILSVNSIYSSTGVGYIGAQVNATEMLSNSRTNGYSNRFTPINTPSGATTEGITFGAGNKIIYIVLKDSRMESSTGANWNAWLASNNTIVYYPIATPTDTKITDATLISQLNAVDSAVLPKPRAFITVGATGTDLPAPLQIAYYGSSEE